MVFRAESRGFLSRRRGGSMRRGGSGVWGCRKEGIFGLFCVHITEKLGKEKKIKKINRAERSKHGPKRKSGARGWGKWKWKWKSDSVGKLGK